MSRTKTPYKARLRSTSANLFVEPLGEVEGSWHGKVPVILAVLPDGREIYITFESDIYSVTSREKYTQAMRRLAESLVKEADRRDSDPNR